MTQLENKVLRDAIRDEIVDVVFDPWDQHEIPSGLFKWVMENRGAHKQNPNTFELNAHPKTRTFQQSVFPTVAQPDVTEYWAVELARILVPKGSVGFLTGIDQVLNDVDGNYYPSNIAYWGSPRFVLSDVDNCRWYLTTSYFNGLQPATRFNQSSAVALPAEYLPGAPYSELHSIPGLWYPANCKNDLKLVIPGQSMLRLFFMSPPTTTYQWEVSGRLTGFIQSTYSREAMANSRMVF